MPLIKLRKTNDAGEEVGVSIINTDQIVEITSDKNITQVEMADGRTRWVKDTIEEILGMVKASN